MDIVTEEKWNDDLFPYRNDGYEYKYFLRAVAQFPKFCDKPQDGAMLSTYQDFHNGTATCRRELAALFAHITYESGHYVNEDWNLDEPKGLKYKSNKTCLNDPSTNTNYCDKYNEWPYTTGNN